LGASGIETQGKDGEHGPEVRNAIYQFRIAHAIFGNN